MIYRYCRTLRGSTQYEVFNVFNKCLNERRLVFVVRDDGTTNAFYGTHLN